MNYVVNDISYKYTPDGKEVLKKVNFSIEKGKVTAIVGPSGCGKSTLVQIFSQVIPKLIGNGELQGSFDVPEGTFVSVVSQSPENQLFGYGVEDAIAFGMENLGLPQEEIMERMEYVLDLLNLQYLRNRSVANLSGGQRQSVCIASVLAMDPDILIMDEPVSSLDPNGKKMVQSILGQLSINGNTTVLVDNNLVWSAGIVDHVIGLLDGEVVFDGTRDDFFKDFALQERLGVIIPQEVEIYRELSKSFPQLELFYTVEEGQKQLEKLIPVREFTNTQVQEEEKELVITVHNLGKTFSDGFHALIDVNANVAKGKVVAVLGQNGSGKTTFVKHLNGLHKPTEGDVRYKGESIIKKTVAQVSKNIILVFQHPEHMLFEETVERELTFCARMQQVPFSEEQLTEVLKSYHLEEDRETFPLNLSMGKKHMLTILSVLFSSADVIILDEPTLGMDGFLIKELADMIKKLSAEGKTVIMISHEIPLVFKTVDEAIILNQGEKIFEGSKESLARRDDIFDHINIQLPPVVLLSKALGLDEICYSVEEFAAKIVERNV
ncbi:ABC transporter [Eisenbergiella tayi]|uniref:Putative HMP/thiamine import ATP-binding protein YkoD n=1 Tax=Eisenbergiella tayi TaxID=1432052 RepID=A0A1E3ATK7_9FIRM|nr:ABC transporter ATP-binding protein [Eisenbergiella tayi]ODM12019.1 putative HMP/thiamine import ATP-binding protein YkoD [Eisenbergiella tayi]OIZ61003.1 ABC transporter [Eisenbergiella tayi]